MTTKETTHTRAIRTFVPELNKLRRARQKTVYEGPIGRIGATRRSRYTLVALSAVVTLTVLVLAALLSPALTVLAGLGAVLLIAGGWPAATGVAELRGVRRVTSHSVIILISGLASIVYSWLYSSGNPLSALPAIAAVGVVASFIAELLRGEGAIGRLESVISCVTGVLASVSVAGWIGLAFLAEPGASAWPIIGLGLGIALFLGLLGIRVISAGPKEGPRRGAVTLGVTPVAFIGVLAYVCATFLTPVIG
ncbi:hypothetical protein [Rothia nasimurium]|uniref:hypothetical protein n=1 Tax=Rothia nasimurium TaxID=85336 RepID=UPI001F4704EA|nr:hypothetical protein [Rothia nasimurium]